MVETQKLSWENESTREEVLSFDSCGKDYFCLCFSSVFPNLLYHIMRCHVIKFWLISGVKGMYCFHPWPQKCHKWSSIPTLSSVSMAESKGVSRQKKPNSWLEMSCPPRFSDPPWTIIEARYTFIELISEVWSYLLLQQNLIYPDRKHLPISAVNSFYPATSHNLSSLQASSW